MNLTDPGTLKGLLGRHGIRADKSLGQHFLCSQKAVDAIARRLSDLHGMLEIGPGPGVLTSALSEQALRFVALELDLRMISVLSESSPKAEVVQGDALQVDLRSLLEGLPEPRGLVSNLPYYITGPLLTRISEVRELLSRAVLMMQKEVAQRVVAPAGNSERGSLSVFLQYQFEISVVMQVPAQSFFPPPKVDSTILEFVPRESEVSAEVEKAFFRLIRFGFTQPRKTLANNLVAGYHVDRSVAVDWMGAVGVEERARAQELSVQQWLDMARALSEL